MSKVLLVGAGQLGSRHLQSIINHKIDCNVTVVEPNIDSINLAKKRLADINQKKYSNNISWLDKIQNIKDNYDIAIISTSAKNRSLIINEISKLCKVNYWIIEKILAQSSEELLTIENATSLSKKAFVNTCRRQMKWHFDLKKKYFENSLLTVIKTGRNWGLACNAIHFIDLLEWWTNEKIASIETEYLDKNWVKSNRQGYFEVTGQLNCKFSKGSNLILRSSEDVLDNVLEVNLSEKNIWKIYEDKGIAKSSNGDLLNGKFELQSEMTGDTVAQILEKGSCDLTKLSDSIRQHRVLLDALLKNWNFSKKKYDKLVPIT